MDFTWAAGHPEVHKVCALFGLGELSAPLRHAYAPVEGFAQDGPQCGLVALAMYLKQPTAAALLAEARERGFTNHGEIFSAESMANLARTHLEAGVELHRGAIDCEAIREKLFDGACLLVPYDTEKDNAPGQRNGTKAHWALVVGIVESAAGGFYAIARHGKQRNVAIWSLASLSESNAQLNEVGRYEKQSDFQFRLPEGGIGGPLGLKLQCVILTAK